MKRFALTVLSAMLACSLVALAACTDQPELVAHDATDLLQEDFGIAVKKGDADMLAAVNAVVDAWTEDGTLDQYAEYYSALANGDATAPEGLKTAWELSSYTEELHLFTEAGFAPYEFTASEGYPEADGGYLIAGIDVAIACQVAENLECKLVLHNVTFDLVIQSMNAQSGKAMAAAGMTITEERMKSVDFSNVYSSSTLSIVCKADATYTKLADLDGLKIGVQQGTSGDLIATEAQESGYSYTTEDEEGNPVESTPVTLGASTEIVRMDSYAALLQALKSGKIDVIFMDKIPALLLIENA